VWVLSAVYIIKLRVEASIIVSNDQLVLAPVARQLIKSFAEVAYLVGFIIGIVHESNIKFLVAGRLQYDRKAIGGYIFEFDQLEWI